MMRSPDRGRHASLACSTSFTTPLCALSRDGRCEPLEHLHRCRPIDAPIRDALPVEQRLAGDEVLPPGDEVALDHDTADPSVARFDLHGDVLHHDGLLLRALATVAVAREPR